MYDSLLNRVNEREPYTIEYASDFETLGMPTKNGIHLFWKSKRNESDNEDRVSIQLESFLYAEAMLMPLVEYNPY